MTLRRVLVVGCGGSGGKTLCYMLDQLQSDLARFGVHTIPSGWKFVSIDVPVGPERGPEGLERHTVRSLGADYIGVGTAAGYSSVHATVFDTAASRQVLPDLATWAPRTPNTGVPVSEGAGQYRAIGRVLTLSRLQQINAGLQRAWDDLNSTAARAEMQEATSRLLGSQISFDPGLPPVVLVVSSMAGGAGASMALDVCRSLASIQGVNPDLVAVFMVGADVFSYLPPADRAGVNANSLAMMGEIIAAQSGAAADSDGRLWSAFGTTDVQSPVPFARVFPIGSMSGMAGRSARFGDGRAVTIYRGLSRGLTALMTSPTAMGDFVSYDLGNLEGLTFRQDKFGWSSSANRMVWGSMGFASLSMGRDRYAEYAAQRLARGAVDRLVKGHLRDDSTASPDEQLRELVASQHPHILRSLSLWDGEGDFYGWFNTAGWEKGEVARRANGIVADHLTPHLPESVASDGATWAQQVRRQLSAQAKRLSDDGEDAVYRWAFDYCEALCERIIGVVGGAVGQFGLPYGRAIVEDLAQHLRTISGQARVAEQRYADTAPDGLDDQTEGLLGQVRRTLTNGQAILDAVVSGATRQLGKRLRGQACGYLARVWDDLGSSFLAPLSQALSREFGELDRAVGATAQGLGLAVLDTDEYAEWPTEQAVPLRFDQATSEVLLTSSADYPGAFTSHVVAALPGRTRYQEAREEILTAVIEGRWPTVGGSELPGDLIEVLRPTRPAVFDHDPRDGRPLVPAPGSFGVRTTTDDVLTRARMFVDRPQASFRTFCDESLRDYLTPSGTLPPSEQRDREARLSERFVEALQLALPLSQPNEHVVQQMHNASVQYQYKFSAIPFIGMPVATALRGRIVGDNQIDQQRVLGRFDEALDDDLRARRIEIFGSYPNYAPICFESVLEPARTQWRSATDVFSREPFWKWRRSRPLTGALPCSADERRAMIAGWFLGQITGHLDVGRDPIRIYSDERGSWLGLPDPLVTSSQWLRNHPEDLLPAVLESMLLAVASAGSTRDLSALWPYQALRTLWDDSAMQAAPPDRVSGVRTLERWLQGEAPVGGQSLVEIPTGAGRAERATAAKEFLAAKRDAISQFTAGVRHLAEAQQLAMIADLGPDLAWALGALDAALTQAERPTRITVI